MSGTTIGPLMLSTWSFGRVANAAGWPVLARGGSALDAVVAGATAVEDDPSVDSVGIGAIPDASGRVSLDASVMTDPDRCGSVCFVQNYPHAAALARRVMDQTAHVMLAGAGAEAFARDEGFECGELLTESSRKAHARWLEGKSAAELEHYRGCRPAMNVEERYRKATSSGHDTVCCLARDAAGCIAGACTTSGLGHKMHGRVGDSPIIGAGLYVDQSAGAATATGNGELVIGVCGSFLAVELMRQGREPVEAILEVLRRIQKRWQTLTDQQVGMMALRTDGCWAAAALRPGFTGYVSTSGGTHQIADVVTLIDR